MSHRLKSSPRLAQLAAAVLATAAFAALPTAAFAQEKPAPAAAEAPADSLTVARDATTGKLRPATAEEHAALAQIKAAKARNLRATSAPSVQKFHRSGAVGVQLSEEMMSANTLIAVKGADGKIEMRHAGSKAEAEAAVQAGPSATPKFEME